MINYYDIINISKEATTDDIKARTKFRLSEIKKSLISSTQKAIEINKLKEAYYFLKDYHRRRELDEYLERSSVSVLEDILQLGSIDKPIEQFQE
mgnify:FL=1